MAGFTENSGSNALMSDINVTPFVDVALVLLVIFMATSGIIIRAALEVDVPVATNAVPQEERAIRSIVLNEDGSIKLDGKPVTRERLAATLEREVAKRDQRNRAGGHRASRPRVIISAGGRHAYQSVMDIVDMVQGAGVRIIALNTKYKEEAEP